MIKFLADENFDNHILRGVWRRKQDIDIVRVQDVGLYSFDDESVLEAAATDNRVLLTHDIKTIIAFAYDRVKKGLPMPGVFEVSKSLPLKVVIEDILLLEASLPDEWEGQVRFLPLK